MTGNPPILDSGDGAVTGSWEANVAELLSDLSAVQTELLDVLKLKQTRLLQADTRGLADLAPREQALISRLEACHAFRQRLLDHARGEGLPAASLTDLAKALPAVERGTVQRRIDAARSRLRLLQHHSLTNWVFVQRTLIHLSQMLEIIATGGQPEPTYKKEQKPSSLGSLVDHAA